MYWRISSFPELAHLSETDRARLIRTRCGLLFYLKLVGLSAALALISLIMLGILIGILDQVLLGGRPVSADWPMVLIPIAYSLLALFWYHYLVTRIRGQLRIFLAEHRSTGRDLPMCLNCGYATAEGQATCPECGAVV